MRDVIIHLRCCRDFCACAVIYLCNSRTLRRLGSKLDRRDLAGVINFQLESNGLTRSQIDLIVGTVVGVVVNTSSIANAIHEYDALAGTAIVNVQRSLLDQLTAQLDHIGPAFAVSLVGIPNLASRILSGGVIDAHCIQIEIIVLAVRNIVECRVIGWFNDDLVGTIFQTLTADYGNLIQSVVAIIRHRPLVVDLIGNVASVLRRTANLSTLRQRRNHFLISVPLPVG